MRRAVVVAVLVGACRSTNVTPDTAPLAEPAADPPPWFGTVGARHIAGKLVDAEGHPLAGTIHLRLSAPDATVWAGIDREVGADGHFAFAAPRAGRFTLFATAPGATSRVVDVDALMADAIDITVFAFPCTPQSRAVQSASGDAIANARIDIAGTIIAHTDKHGGFSVCANRRPLVAAIHASGFAATTRQIASTPDTVTPSRPHVLDRGIVIRGRILDAAGNPLPNFGVQPQFVYKPQMSHGSPSVPDVPLVVTSDADGRFVFRELSETDPGTPNGAAYTAISFQGDDIEHHHGAFIGAQVNDELVLRRGLRQPDLGLDRMLEDMQPVRWTVRGRATRDGQPVPDAEISRTEINIRPRTIGYSRADGTFAVDIVDFGRREQRRATLEIIDAAGNSATFECADGEGDAVFELP